MPPKKPVTSGGKSAANTPSTSKAPSKTASKSSITSSKNVKVTPGKKQGGPSRASVTSVGKEKKKEKEWTPQDTAARTIQTKYRQYNAKKELLKKKQEKLEYEEKMDQLEKEAFLHIIKLQQEEAERKQAKEDEERRRKQAEVKRRKKMLEAAFDGDIDLMKDIINEVLDIDTNNGIGNDVIGRALRTKHLLAIVECEDANNNTPLSEAANGGHADAVKFLLEKGAHPDTQGQFKRTPLYRAAFAGHVEVAQVLLENGADPKIYAQDGQTPAEIASNEPMKEILTSWDYAKTEVLKKKLEAAKEKRAEEDRKRKEAEVSKREDEISEAQKEHDAKQKQLDYSICELNKRITEHDKAVAEGFARPDITLQGIHDQELEVEMVRLQVTKARDNLAKAKLRLRESVKGDDAGELEDDVPGLKVMIKELDDVLFKDVGNRIKDSGKWPLLIDTSGQGSTFLRYRDTNFVIALRPVDMESNNVRRALIGALRFGKPFIIDMMEVDMYETCIDRFDEIMPGLMASIMDKSILQEEKYLKLVKKEDGPEYDKLKFNELRLANFKFMIVSKNPYLNVNLFDMMYVIRIMIAV